MESHWENSSSNSIVKDILEQSTEATRAEIEALISGGYVEKPLISGLAYQDMDSKEPQKKTDTSVEHTFRDWIFDGCRRTSR